MTQYGLLGHPLGHSFSRKFHNERFASLGIDAEYLNFDLADISTLPQVIAEHPELSGLNVTIPYKQEVMQFLDELDPVAARIGAVNTVKFIRGSVTGRAGIPGLRLIGYNTDIIGFRDSIRPLLIEAGILAPKVNPETAELGTLKPETLKPGTLKPGTLDPETAQLETLKPETLNPETAKPETLKPETAKPEPSALILGTGGASRAIRVALEDMGIEPVFVSRTPAPGRLTYADLTPEVIAQHRVIVNCSPVGMFPHVDACPDIPYECLTPGHVCYDLIYNPAEPLFLTKAKAQGARIMSGGAMLEGQAIASYNIWIS